METRFKPIDPAQYAHAYQGIPYCDRDPLQVVDIYVPGDDGDYPLIVYVNGGGWVQQLPRHNTVPGVWAAPSQGYALASVGYRLAPQSHWPAQAHDLKAALRFLRAHAKEYGYNADKITVWGNSAGGHIANMCAATNGVPLFEDLTMGNPDESSSIQCVISYYAPSDLYQADLSVYISEEEVKALTENPLAATDDRPGMNFQHNILLGCKASQNPGVAAAASPINFVTADFPPAYFAQGLDDPIVPWTQTVTMVNKINEVCGEKRAEMDLFPGGHGAPAIKADDTTEKVFDFIDAHIWPGEHHRPPLPEIRLLQE